MKTHGKIYLAGPEVFFPNATDIGRKKKLFCKHQFYEGLFPLDNEISTECKSKKEKAKAITYANMYMIHDCDYVFANLSNFRGTEEHPCCDSGTAWECGYALGLGKKVIAYTNSKNSIPEEIVSHITLSLKVQEFFEIFDHFQFIILPKNDSKEPIKEYLLPKIWNLDNKFSDVHDVNPVTAFILGYRKAKGQICVASLSDMRTQREKYGNIDLNGNVVEDFDLPANIMIAVNTDIYKPE